jgi:hypothetical protein
VLTAGHAFVRSRRGRDRDLPPTASPVDIPPRWEVHPDFDIRRVAVADIAAVVLARPVTDVGRSRWSRSRPPRHPRHHRGPATTTTADSASSAPDAFGSGVARAPCAASASCPPARRLALAPATPRQDTCFGDSADRCWSTGSSPASRRAASRIAPACQLGHERRGRPRLDRRRPDARRGSE